MKKNFLLSKTLSIVLSVCMIFAIAGPTVLTVAAQFGDGLPFSWWPMRHEDDHPSLNEVAVPTVSENPYSPSVYSEKYAIYRTATQNELIKSGHVEAVRTQDYYHKKEYPDGTSSYYTASISPLFNYYPVWGDTLPSNLPYREGNENLFHPDLVLSNDAIYVDIASGPSLSSLSGVGANPDHVYVRLGATVVSGEGIIGFFNNVNEIYSGDPAHMAKGEAKNESVRITVDVPLKDVYELGLPHFYAGNGVMTDMYITLIDDTAPSVTGVEVKKSGSTLILNMTFNEGLSWGNWIQEKELDYFYVDVFLRNTGGGKNQTLRMFVSELGGDNKNVVTFKGELGDFRYANFYIEKISAAGKRPYSISSATPVVDVADKVYYTPMDYIEYDHNIYCDSGVWSFNHGTITDHAGNPVNLSAVVGRRLGYRVESNSFEAAEVIIYNDVTLGADESKIEGAPTEWPKDIDKTHMFAGPDNTITVKLTTYAMLTEAEAKKVSIQLNIKNPDGTPLTARCTSSYSFTEEYTVYGDESGRTMTCLMFENIKLSAGMTMDIAEGEAPQIKVAKMTDSIPNKTAYPYVVSPSRQLYGDFTSPDVEAERLFMNEPEENNGYYVLGIKATVAEDVSKPPYYSGTLKTFADIKLGGGVLEGTPAKYIVSFDEIKADEVAERMASEGKDTTVPVSGTVSLGTYPVPSDRQDYFIYIMIQSGGKLVDGLSLTVESEDLVGNKASDNTFDIDCMIDEVAPDIIFPKSAKIDFQGTNDQALVTVPIRATDYNGVVSLKYAWELDMLEGGTPELDENGRPIGNVTEGNGEIKWHDLMIEPGNEINVTVSKTYGGLDDENKVYNETLWVVAVDGEGNESRVISYKFSVSTEKPQTDAEMVSDPNIPSSRPEITVTGPAHASYNEELDAFTRVTLTLTGGEWQYVTVVKTGETVDLFSFEGRQWYRVKRSGNSYTAVEAIPMIGEGFTLTESHKFYELFTFYGDVRVSFENGYGDMIPATGFVYESATGGSYMSDPNYFTVRYTARNPELLTVNKISFGQMIDMVENEEIDMESDPENYLWYRVIGENSKKGSEPVLFNMTKKRINPMRGTQIYFSLSNILRNDWGVMDVDFEGSYIELRFIDKNGNERVVATEKGFSGANTQFYQIPDKYDDGGDFETGIYYVRAYAKSKGGSVSYYDSSNMILDASVPENDGIWEYSYQLPLESNAWRSYGAEGTPFTSVGVSVSGTDGEIYRSRMLAAYTSGVSGLLINLRTELDVAVLDGITVGEFAGIRYWNKLSAPTDEEIESQPFIKQDYDDGIFITTGFDSIYTEENIPKGVDGMLNGYGLYLVKGVNTICYQVKMSNGYVSPVRQTTIIVTDKTPVLNIAVQDYVPSHHVYQGEEGITNAHSLKLAIESAYSLNGSGLVDVSVVSTYGMTVGKYSGEGENRSLDERFYDDPTPSYNQLDTIVSGLGDEDYAIITENSYTAQYPPSNDNLCTAVFVAYDEYGGMTVVAPQIGDHIRVDNWGGSTDYEYNIDYDGGYRDDPYTVGRDLTQVHTMYNQPVYYGKIVTGYQNLVSYNNGEWIVMEESLPDLSYNLFNIVTNDVTWGSGSAMHGSHNGLVGSMQMVGTSGVIYSEEGKFPGDNFELINWDSAVITFSGGDLSSPVTVPLAGGGANDAGYIGGSYWVDSDGVGRFSFNVASVPLPEGKTVEDLPELDQLVGTDPETGETFDIAGHFYRDFTIRGYNIYGDYFEKSGQVAMYYTEYGVFKYYDKVRSYAVGQGDYYIRIPGDNNYVYVPGYLESMTGHGIVLQLGFETVEYGRTLNTGIFENGEFRKTVTDYYGNEYEIVHTLTKAEDTGTSIKLSTVEKTAEHVTVTLSRADGIPIYVDITDYAIMSVEGNGTAAVTVTVKENVSFSYRYNSDGLDDKVYTLDIENIVKPAPKILWSFDLSDAVEDDNGVAYRYGSVTAYLVDDNFTLTDKYTGKAPQFTFYPDGDRYYLFEGGTVEATVGNETVIIENGIPVMLPVVLKQVNDPLGIFDPITGERIEDTETPGVQILAYSNLNGYFTEKKLAIQVEGARHSDIMHDRKGYTVFEYSGNVGDSAELLRELGWSTAFRFEIEISDRSPVRIFVKEGLPEAAPDYEKGYSDSIDGVTLNSRLLDVKKAAKFTLFIVDKENNYTAIPFEITNIGESPVPQVEKVTLGHDRVRIYVIPPTEAGVSDFSITSLDIGVEVKIDGEAGSKYFGMPYVEYTDNDDYIINYSYSYNGTPVEGKVDAKVYEINVDKIALGKSGVQWSDNKSAEATVSNVTAELSFTHTVQELKTYGEIDSEKVIFEISGNKITVTYLDNHPQIELIVVATNGSRVPVILDGVENIDRSAPEIELVSKVLAENGLSVTITMRSNERALFKEGGYVGELGDDGYYYYTRRVTENKTYKYIFADMTGLMTAFEVEVTEIVTGELELQFSKSPSGEGAVSDPAELTLKIGDVIYVNPSRDVTVYFNGGEGIAARAGAWTEILISDAAGGRFPYIQAFDAYGNVVTEQLSRVEIPDGTAPVISVIKYVLSVVVNADRDDVEEALLENFNAYDDDPNITYAVEFPEDLSSTGVVAVKYIATDSSGNRSEATGRLRIASGEEPWVYVNGEQTDRDASAILKSGEGCTLRVDAGGRPYKIFIKEGVKTVAQMKTDSTVITDYTASTEEISLPELESQTYYTVCILTQDRDYFRIIIYVE